MMLKFILFILIFNIMLIDYTFASNSTRFLLNYYVINTSLKGQTGKSEFLSKISDISKSYNISSNPLCEVWDEIILYDCIYKLNKIPDLHNRYKDNFKEAFDSCYKKYILDNWELINDSIELRFKYVNSEKFKKDVQKREKILQEKR